MSADVSFTLNREQLLQTAERYTACTLFQIEQGGSRHRCAACEETEAAHVVVALRDAMKVAPAA